MYPIHFVAAYNTYAVQDADISFPEPLVQSYDVRVRRETDPDSAGGGASTTTPRGTISVADTMADAGSTPSPAVNSSKYPGILRMSGVPIILCINLVDCIGAVGATLGRTYFPT